MAAQKGAGRPIINIIRKKKQHDEGAHSAAWKIAYADFMTAMMAFFLVMWLISSMSPSQKKGIASYFDPIGTTEGASGVGGVLGGLSITVDGPLSQMSAATAINPPLGSESKTDDAVGAFHTPEHETAEAEEQALQKIQEQLDQALKTHPGLKEMIELAQITVTLEGLRIDLIENYHKPMFELGSSRLTPEAQELLNVVALFLQKLPNKMNITGHTDALAYAGTRFTNWELSSARALETRQYLVTRASNIQINAIVGKAHVSPYVPENPTSPLNRRVSILALRQFEEKAKNLSSHTPLTSKTSEAESEKSELLKIQEIH